MINYLKENNLLSEEFWPDIASVFIKGIPDETNLVSSDPEDKKTQVSQSWDHVAVLEITSDKPAQFYLGYTNLGIIEYLNHPFTTNMKLGMRIGGGDIRFFALPKDLSVELKMNLIATTTSDDTKYKDLILI